MSHDQFIRTAFSDDASQQIFDAVQRNTCLLQQVLDQLSRETVVEEGYESSGDSSDDFSPADFGIASAFGIDMNNLGSDAPGGDPYGEGAGESFDDENEALRNRADDLAEQVESLQREIEILTDQNRQLAGKVAREDVVRTVAPSGGTSPTLTWEERKQQILCQMEDDSFNAEAFLSSLQHDRGSRETPTPAAPDSTEDPIAFVNRLHEELERMGELIRRHEEETHELQELLNQEKVRDQAAAVAEAVDSDEVVRNEREKLRQLQQEWEAKFRDTEIEASLERAKLSRDRLEIEQRLHELEKENAEIRKQTGYVGPTKTSRAWAEKLGLDRHSEAD